MEIPTGTTYGNLTVISEVERSGYNRRFLCRCVCGSETVKFLSNLKQAYSTSCGCMHSDTSARGREAVIANRRARSQESAEGRICLTCDTWKPWSKFSTDKRRANGRTSNCYDCGNLRYYKTKYGITKAEWYWLLEQQGGACALCSEKSKSTRRLAVDHDHSCCGNERACKQCIRGLLCDICNRMLGLAELRAAHRARFSDYLRMRPFSVAAGRAAAVLEDVP